MTVEELLQQIPNLCWGLGKKGQYRVIVPTENEGDIDEIVELEITSVLWDDAEKRLILNW